MTTTEMVGAHSSAAATTTEVVSLRHGEVVAATGPAGTTTRTGHDVLGRAVTTVDAAGNTTNATFETAQQHGRNATTTLGADQVAVTEVRDPIGRITERTDNIDRGEARPGHVRVIETREYPDPGTIAVTDAWGATTVTRQDVFGGTVETVSPTGLAQVTAHDDVAGTVTTGLTPTGNLADAEQIAIETRDLSGRTTGTAGTRRDEQPVLETTTSYDGLGRTVSSFNGALTTDTEYDAFGNPTTTTMTPASAGIDQVDDRLTASRRFDGFGAALEKTLTTGDESRSGGAREVDARGRTIRETDQLGRVTTYDYSVDDLVTRMVDGSGRTVEREYHEITRAPIRTTATSANGDTVRTAEAHDPVTGLRTAVWDPDDRPGTEITTTYDAHRNPLTVTYPDGSTVIYSYDEHGRRTSITDIAGNLTELVHAADGTLTRAVQRDADGDPIAEVTYHHDDFGRVDTLTRGNGVVTSYTFTSASEIASEITTRADGHLLADRAYTYDPRGNLIERRDTTQDPGAQAETTTTSYTYDAHDRLTGSTERAGGPDGEVTRGATYEVTASGDIRSETVTSTDAVTSAPTETVREFEYSPLGELVAQTVATRGTHPDPAEADGAALASAAGPGDSIRQTQSHDASGNLTHALDGTVTTYDAANRPMLATAPDGTTTRTVYWADGTRRAQETTDAATGETAATGFYWDGVTLINDRHDAALGGESGVAAYLIGGSRHSRTTMVDDGDVRTDYYGTDRHLNVTDLTDADGLPVIRYAYTDYGSVSVLPVGDRPVHEHGLHRNAFGHAGEWADPSGLQHLRTRSYQPATMRFTTMDAEELHNLYAFGDLNPITNIDPTGQDPILDHENWITIGLGVAGIVGAVVGLMFPPAAMLLVPKLAIAIQVAAGFSILADALAVGGAAAKEAGWEPADPVVAAALEWSSTAAGFAGLGIAMGVEAATRLGRTAVLAMQRWQAGLDYRQAVERELQSVLTQWATAMNRKMALVKAYAALGDPRFKSALTTLQKLDVDENAIRNLLAAHRNLTAGSPVELDYVAADLATMQRKGMKIENALRELNASEDTISTVKAVFAPLGDLESKAPTFYDALFPTMVDFEIETKLVKKHKLD